MSGREFAWVVPSVLLTACLTAMHSPQATADTIIWLKPTGGVHGFARNDDAIKDIAAALQSAANVTKSVQDIVKDDGQDKRVVVATYPTLGAVVLNLNIEITKDVLSQLKKLGYEKSNRFISRDHDADLAIDEPSIDTQVSLFDTSCDDDGAKDLTGADNKPTNILRVWNGATPVSTSHSVWVVDSGLDSKVIDAKLVQVNTDPNTTLARNCAKADPNDPSMTCKKDGYDNDPIGHGTMIAGIIGGQNGNSSGIAIGMLGVSPGINIIPVKIFGNKGAADLSKGPMAGLEWVSKNANPQDVVNISWGAYWIDNLQPEYLQNTVKKIMQRVRDIANNGANIVIAAGNADPKSHAAWVQFVVPANTTGYQSKGSIYAVAAVDSKWDPTNGGSDALWTEILAAGNKRALSNYGLGRPNDPLKGILAEPGVDVDGLWPGTRRKGNVVLRTNKCSGTSFAAAHLSGILAQKNPVMGSTPIADDPLELQSTGAGMRVGTLQ
jgi:hypothetical protein